jgi:hypothetical protein
LSGISVSQHAAYENDPVMSKLGVKAVGGLFGESGFAPPGVRLRGGAGGASFPSSAAAAVVRAKEVRAGSPPNVRKSTQSCEGSCCPRSARPSGNMAASPAVPGSRPNTLFQPAPDSMRRQIIARVLSHFWQRPSTRLYFSIRRGRGRLIFPSELTNSSTNSPGALSILAAFSLGRQRKQPEAIQAADSGSTRPIESRAVF